MTDLEIFCTKLLELQDEAVRFARLKKAPEPDEAVDEAQLRAVKGWQTYTGKGTHADKPASLKTWYFGIVKNVIREQARDDDLDAVSLTDEHAATTDDGTPPEHGVDTPNTSEHEIRRYHVARAYGHASTPRVEDDSPERTQEDLEEVCKDIDAATDQLLDLALRRPDIAWLNSAAAALDGLRNAILTTQPMPAFDANDNETTITATSTVDTLKFLRRLASEAREHEFTWFRPSESKPEEVFDAVKAWLANRGSSEPEDIAVAIAVVMRPRNVPDAVVKCFQEIRAATTVDDRITQGIRALFRLGEWRTASNPLTQRRKRARHGTP